MTGRRKRQTRGSRTSPGTPEQSAPYVRTAPSPGVDPSQSPDAGATAKPTTGRVAELVRAATMPGATAEHVAEARAELARVLATGLDLALEQGDLDQMMKLTDRLTKLLPAAGPAAAPEPPAGGDPDGVDDPGTRSAAERFRLVSGEVGD